MNLSFHQICLQDNFQIAKVIRSVLKEYGVDKPGTVYTDPTTDALFQLFQTPGSIYWIAKQDDEIIGGCGIFPTTGLPQGYAELVKLYVSSSARGKGIGYQLMEICFESAVKTGYKKLYLETLPELNKAVSLYQRLGFEFLKEPLGDSGHFACDIWMLKDLQK
jgi:putative acetyltransferase